jgi:uncharacterized membrane protein YfcA
MELATMLLVLGAGIVGGAISAIAGGASFITFPALLLAGLPPLEANITNFVGLAPGNLAGLAAFRDEVRRLAVGLGGPIAVTCLGTGVGSLLLLAGGSEIFQILMPWLMLVATLLFAAGPHLRQRLVKSHPSGLHNGSPAALIVLFCVSAYGGYFGSGLGVIMLTALTIFGYDDIHEANVVKNLLLSLLSVIGALIYIAAGKIVWPAALLLFLGTGIGGFAGGHLAKRTPHGVLRNGIIVFAAILTAYYFWKY